MGALIPPRLGVGRRRDAWRLPKARRLLRLLFVGLLLAPLPSAFAQPVDPSVVGDTLRPVLDLVVATALPPIEGETGQDLHRQDIRVWVALDVVDVEYDLPGILFGGGKIGADAHAVLRLEFRALAAETLDEAIRSATGDANASLNRTFGVPTSRLALTAEEVRTVGAGLLLSYFQQAEVQSAKQFLERTLPGLLVQDLGATWSETAPLSNLIPDEVPDPPDPDVDPTDPASAAGLASLALLTGPVRDISLREPPIVLDATARLSYLNRLNLVDMVRSVADPTAEKEARDALKDRLRNEQGDRFRDRNAFNLVGYGQVLNVSVPSGWRIEVSLAVPDGYTIEGVTDELVLAEDHRSAGLALDGLAREKQANPVALATLSNRFLVTTVLLGAVLLAGTALRLPIEFGVLSLHHRLAQRRAAKAQGPSKADGEAGIDAAA